MKNIMFGNSLMILAVAILVMAGFELIPSIICWAAFLLLFIGFIIAVEGYFNKDK